MTRTPTAEEVLGLYLEWKKREDEFDAFLQSNYVENGNKKDGPEEAWNKIRDDLGSRINIAAKSFYDASRSWQASQGPVTREWFEERFGGTEYVVARLGDPKSDCWWIVLYYDCFHGFPIVRLSFQTKPTAEYGMEWQLRLATRNQIEVMVELLGRKEP